MFAVPAAAETKSFFYPVTIASHSDYYAHRRNNPLV